LAFPNKNSLLVSIGGIIGGNQEIKKKLDRYSLVISLEKYDLLILQQSYE